MKYTSCKFERQYLGFPECFTGFTSTSIFSHMSDPGQVHCVVCEHTALTIPCRIPESQLRSDVPNDVAKILIVKLLLFLLLLEMVLRTMSVAKCCQDVRLFEFWSVLSSGHPVVLDCESRDTSMMSFLCQRASNRQCIFSFETSRCPSFNAACVRFARMGSIYPPHSSCT